MISWEKKKKKIKNIKSFFGQEFFMFFSKKTFRFSHFSFILIIVIMILESYKNDIPKMREFGTFNNFHSMVFNVQNKISDIHVIHREKYVCQLDIDLYKPLIYFDESMKYVPDCKDIDKRLNFLYNEITRFSTHYCIFWGIYVGHDTVFSI